MRLFEERAPSVDFETALEHAPLLMTTVELVAAGGGVTFGEALETAKLRHGFLVVPSEIEAAILTAAFRIIASRRLPGAADA